MGLYYTHCTQCNADGSYENLKPKCGQCNGKGKDYIDDTSGQKKHALEKGRGRGPGGKDLELLYDHNV